MTEDVKNHLDFLQSLDKENQWLFNDSIIINAIRRYQHIWIPFIQNVSKGIMDDLNFAPPIGKNSNSMF